MNAPINHQSCSTNTPDEKESNDCPVCLHALDGSTICLSCNHSFHGSCIRPWVKNSTHKNCPLCRKTISPNIMMFIFSEGKIQVIRSSVGAKEGPSDFGSQYTEPLPDINDRKKTDKYLKRGPQETDNLYKWISDRPELEWVRTELETIFKRIRDGRDSLNTIIDHLEGTTTTSRSSSTSAFVRNKWFADVKSELQILYTSVLGLCKTCNDLFNRLMGVIDKNDGSIAKSCIEVVWYRTIQRIFVLYQLQRLCADQINLL